MLDNSERSVVALWNEIALEAIRLGDPKPTEITRGLHIAHAAMYDAWAAYDNEAVGAYFTGVALGSDSTGAREQAISFAAFHTLVDAFPAFEYLFRTLMADLGFDPDAASSDLSTPEGIGIAAAETALLIRSTDGSNAENEFADTSNYVAVNSDDPSDPVVDPNAWTPLRVPNGTVRDENGIPIATDNPASYDVQKPLGPHWGGVTPFAIADSDDYMPPAPPKLGDFSEYTDANGVVTTGDAAYREQFGELVDISAGLTAEQKVIAEYWADGPQTSTPPGHWNEIAHDISVRDGHSLESDVKLFFALNNALFDTGIAVWDAKYTYDYVRPQSAIRYLFDGQQIDSWAGPNQGTQTIAGETWQPYQNVTFVTPPFPEFTSGHSGFSYAAASVLEAFTGSDVLYDGTSTGAYDLDGDGAADLIGYHATDELAFEDYDGPEIVLTWDTVWDAAAEAGLSRLYGGIHIQDGDLYGRQIGADVGADVWAATKLLFDRDGDNVFDAGDAIGGRITLGLGSDEIIGGVEDVDGLVIEDFAEDDRLILTGSVVHDGSLLVSSGSAIVEVDVDGDGTIDATAIFEGNFANQQFVAITADNETEIRLATGSDVELTDAAERFITEDDAPNVVAAGAGDDVLISAGGGDILDGDAGADVLLGGDADDVLIGGSGADRSTGGGGADVFSFDANDEVGNGFVAEFIADFELGTDLVELSGYNGLTFDNFVWTPLSVGIGLALPNARVIVFEGIFASDDFSESDFAFPASGRNVTFAREKPQFLTDENDRYITSGIGNDDVLARGGDDAVFTGLGDDTARGGEGADVINTGAGSDLLEGGQGSDRLTGGTGADIFRFFASDDGSGGFVTDFISDFEVGIDRIELFGYSGISSFSDVSFLALETGLGANLGPGRFIILEGIFDQSDLSEVDFRFDGEAPTLLLDLRDDTGEAEDDEITSDPAIVGETTDDVGIDTLAIQRNGGSSFEDVSDYLEADGSFKLDAAALEEIFGSPLEDGPQSYAVRLNDRDGNSVEGTISYTLDRAAPTVVSAPADTFLVSPNTLSITFSEAMGPGAFDLSGYRLTDSQGAEIEMTSLDRISDSAVLLNLSDTLSDEDYSLEIPASEDLAGNAPDVGFVANFSVDALTRIVSVGPTDGTERANLDRQIVVEFDRPVDPATVTSSSFQVVALGEPLEGRITVSSNGQVVTFFPDDLLPAATELRIKVDGDVITGLDGKPVDADRDGTAGGMFMSEFQTITLTPIVNTNIEGFIFDSNYRDDDGFDIPLEGVVVKVVGLPGVEAVTDAAGRFFLENLPIPQVYLDFDASNVVNRPDFDYGTIVKPVNTIAGQTVGLASSGKAFNIYFAALSEGDVTQIVEGQETEAGIGENGLANLTELFPNIDPSEWEKLKVTIPADSLSFDDGTLAEEVSVMVFEPDRIPAPIPQGFDPTVVFTVKAGDATNVDGKAQIDFPNVDNLPLGAKRPILSFDHDGGEWAQTGSAIVVDDGNGGTVLRSEGDTGVDTLGWKFIGLEDIKNFFAEIFNYLGDIASSFGETLKQLAITGLRTAATISSIVDILNVVPGLDTINTALTFVLNGAADQLENGFGNISAETKRDFLLSLGTDLVALLPGSGSVAATLGDIGITALGVGETLNSWKELRNQVSDLGNEVLDFPRFSKQEAVGQIDKSIQGLEKVEAAVRSLENLQEIQEGIAELDTAIQEGADPAPDDVRVQELRQLIEATSEDIASTSNSNSTTTFRDALLNAGKTASTSVSDLNDNLSGLGEKAGELSYLVELGGGVVVSGTTQDGTIPLQLPADGVFDLYVGNSETGSFSKVLIDSSRSGAQVLFFDDGSFDEDDDGLSLTAERLFLTSPDRPDSDNDGLLDGAEIEQGLDPLDGVGFPTGVIGALTLKGEAKDLTIIGSIDGEGQTAFVATGSHGLAVVDASQFSNPILVGELQLPGNAEQVSVDAARDLAFVAAGDAGVHFIDISDPNLPALISTETVPGEVKNVLSLGGAVLVGSDTLSLFSSSGEFLSAIFAPDPILDIKQKNGVIYVLTDFELQSYEFDGLALSLLDTVELPFPVSRRTSSTTVRDDPQLFIEGETAFISNGYESATLFVNNTVDRGGYVTVDLTDPTALALISDIQTPEVQSGFADMALNGSGLAIVASGFRGVQIHDASDPTDTYSLLTEIPTDGSARAVEIASGIAYVADEEGGLKVINYLPFDNLGTAPTISIQVEASDADPDTAAIQGVEGETIRIETDITDDVQVRNVELLLNGEVIQNDVSPPFDLFVPLPRISDVGNEVRVSVRATDTGGNVRVSDEFVIELVPDTTPPEVQSVSFEDGDFALSGNTTVQVQFSESMDISSINAFSARLSVSDVGFDANAADVAFLVDDAVVQFTFADVPEGDAELSFDLLGAQDRSGNALQEGIQPISLMIVDQPVLTIDTAFVDESPTTSDGNYLAFKANLSTAFPEEVSVEFRILSGTGTVGIEGDAYVSSFGTLSPVVFAPGETSKTIFIRTTGSQFAEDEELDEAIVLQAFSVQGAEFAGGGTTLEATGWILDVDGNPNPLAGFVSRPNIVEGDAGEKNAVFEISFSRPIPEALTLAYETVDGGAQAGQDYTAVSGTIDLVAGQTVASVRVPILGDGDVELSETFTLAVTTDSEAVAEIAQGQATILDDDAGGALPTVSVAGAVAAESLSTSDNNYLGFAVTLSEASTEEVSVEFRILSGTGTVGIEGDAYVSSFGTLSPVVFAPGETSKTIFIRTTGSQFAEDEELDEAIVLQAFSVQGAEFAGGGTTLEATGWILDVDGNPNPLAGFVSRPNIVEGDAGEKNAVFEISFSRPIPEALTLAYETVDGGAQAGQDYTAVSGTIDLVAGQTVASVRVPILGDGDVELSETFTLAVTTDSEAVAEIAQGQATILDDDAGGALPTVSVAGAVAAESLSTSDNNYLGFAVTLSEASTEEVSVEFRILSGTGTVGIEGDAYVSSFGTLSPVVFAPGETSKTIFIRTTGSQFAEDEELDEAIVLQAFSVQGAEFAGGGTTLEATGWILDVDGNPNPLAGFVSRPNIVEGDAGEKNAVFEISFSRPIPEALTLAYETVDGGAQAGQDYTAVSGTIDLVAGQTVASVRVPILGDGDVELSETFTLAVTTDSEAVAEIAQGQATILDDDAGGALPTVSVAGAVAAESLSTSDNNYLGFAVTLSEASTEEVSVEFRILSGTGTVGIEGDAYVSSFGTLSPVVFAPGETSKTIFIRTTGSQFAEDEELDEAIVLQAFSVQGAEFAGGGTTLEATGWILDVDGNPNPLAGFVSRPNIVEGDAGEKNAVFEISFSRPIPEALTLAYETVDGGAQAGQDYTAVSGTIDLVAGQTVASVRVPILGDGDVELSETFTLAVTTDSEAVAEIAQGQATILDDDAGGALPTVSVAGAVAAESLSTSDNNYLGFAVTLSEASTEEVSVEFRILSGTGTVGIEGDAYVSSFGTLSPVVFAPGETSKTIFIRTAGNQFTEEEELDEAIVLQAFSVQGAEFAGGGTTLEATGWILDVDGNPNPLAGFVSRPNIVEGDAGEKNAVFEISFSRPIPEALTLAYETVDGGAQAGQDYTAVSGTIDLVAGQTVASVRVPILGDTDVELSETFTLAVTTDSTAVAEIAQGQATILDDDDDAGGALALLSMMEVDHFEIDELIVEEERHWASQNTSADGLPLHEEADWNGAERSEDYETIAELPDSHEVSSNYWLATTEDGEIGFL